MQSSKIIRKSGTVSFSSWTNVLSVSGSGMAMVFFGPASLTHINIEFILDGVARYSQNTSSSSYMKYLTRLNYNTISTGGSNTYPSITNLTFHSGFELNGNILATSGTGSIQYDIQYILL